MMQPVDTNHTTEEFPYGVTLTWVDDKRIAIVATQGDMRAPAIDTWSNVIINLLQEWPAMLPIATLHNLSHPNQGLTPYARYRTLEILEHIPDNHPTFTAVVLPPTFMNRIIGMFIRSLPFRVHHHHTHMFTSVDEALDWLRQNIKTATTD